MNQLGTDGLEGATVGRRLVELHERIRAEFPQVGRVSAALYDPTTDLLSTFVHSTEDPASLSCDETRLSELPSLRELGEARRPRVLAGPSGPLDSPAAARGIAPGNGYKSSYTIPFYYHGTLRGFLFFDSDEPDSFPPEVARHIRVLADLTAEVLLRSLERVGVFRSTLHLMASLSRFRDAETGDHLFRVSHYARLIARNLPAAPDRSDELSEFIFLFTPAHDIAKIAIPDSILCKPGALTPVERAIMEKHVTMGLSMVDKIVVDTALADMPQLSMLRNIVLHHHERLDGSGYPNGLSGDAIPLEARIVGVADVFDALRSPRPYKERWTSERALEYLHGRRGRDFDPACVDALLSQSDLLEAIAGGVAGEPR